MPFAQMLLGDPAIPTVERQQALDRIFADPGIPQDSTTSPFWLKEPHTDFVTHSSKPLPTEADVVIIGSGITGASIARTLLQDRTGPSSLNKAVHSVFMLEARDICSGATGRNGGHILETADEYAELADVFGDEVAKKTLRFRLAHLKEMLKAVEDLGLTEKTQARKVQFLSAYFGEEPWKAALERLRRFQAGMPEESAEWIAYDRQSMPEEFKLSRAHGVITGPAGALWPYKFVTGVLSHLLSQYPEQFRVQGHTAVTAIHDNTSSDYKYRVETSRGVISARHVIHCTNAHVTHLVPGLRGRIFPLRGQMSAQTPGNKFPCQAAEHSWMFSYDRGFDYLTQLPSGQMMFGGGFARSEGGGIADLGIATDDELSLYCDIHLSGALPAVFGRQNWGQVKGDPVQAMWTGNMAFSTDGFPWVGQLPSSVTHRAGSSKHDVGSEWVSAAFGGEGMVQAWLCGKALATMLLLKEGLASTEADISWLPDQMIVTDERIAWAILPRTVESPHKASL
ncbi:hypothetical protein N7532_009302 [Penicillium argentinense]|uniref:FAD dependent oxidoreductase domain-containing protein n=1 Tax=Penicillium argentinense TaxID=1131581 RepID=A0A9W9EZ40_9EURO|nr:uncharacterized protein N7532_009302 [Penicillium argentinense]KAJ5090618.1 hypothetical protein N7532_009302 [Penicillium argentinense]